MNVRQTLTRQLDDIERRVRHRDGELRATPAAPVRDSVADVFDGAQSVATIETNRLELNRLGDQRRRLRAALARLEAGRYGECERCGEPIAPGRLRALPEAALCVACQTAEERSYPRHQGDRVPPRVRHAGA